MYYLNKRSDFVQQNYQICSFTTSDSWVILSKIEQSIKDKIESVGTPLKDWDIKINYGIKTGCNEAFIIDTAKREEILANCTNEEERQKTAELISPNYMQLTSKRKSNKLIVMIPCSSVLRFISSWVIIILRKLSLVLSKERFSCFSFSSFGIW